MNELSSAPIGQLMKKFCIPCAASLLVSCLYNIVDQIFVGIGIGYLGNAATGVVFPITVVGWGLSLFFGDGGAALLSLEQGRGKTESSGSIAAQSIGLTLVFGILLAAGALFGGSALLQGLGATDATIEMAWRYGRIIYCMMPLAMVQNAMASLIRAKGHPAWSMTAMCAGAVINIIGDPLAIFVFHMGIEGAAWATIIGQFVSFLLCAAFFVKGENKLSIKDFAMKVHMVMQIMQLGLSSLITQLTIVMITVVSNILLVRYGALSAYGSDIPLAAFVVIMKLFQIVINIAIGIAAGCQPIAGFSYGSGNGKRLTALFNRMCAWTFGISLICTAAFVFFPTVFINLFGGGEKLYMDFASRCLQIYLCMLPLGCLQKVCAIFLQSIGLALRSAFLAVLRDGLLIVLSLLFAAMNGLEGLLYAAPAADAASLIITIAVMIPVLKKIREMSSKQEALQTKFA